MGQMIYLETGSLNPYYNLAFEEYVLCNRRDGDYLMLWQNDNTVVIGQNQNAEGEINRAFVDEHHINVVRRSTGGGAVYHDLGNLNYSFITDAENADRQTMLRFTEPVVAALKGLGLQAEASGRNDILVEGRKVSGTAQRLYKHRILHHGTLLFSANSEMVSGALNVDPRKFRSKSAKSVRSRIGNIKDFLEREMDIAEFWTYLKDSLSDGSLMTGELSERELEQVEKLKREKYDTWEWNFGRSPKYTMNNKRYWPGGCLEAYAAIENGAISDISFRGDFLSLRPLDDLLAELQSVPFTVEAVEVVLERCSLKEYFGEITKDEILMTLFDNSKETSPYSNADNDHCGVKEAIETYLL